MEEIIALAADNLPHRIAMINHMLKHGKQITEMKADDDGRIRVFFKDTEPPLPNPLRNYLGDGEDDDPPPTKPQKKTWQVCTCQCHSSKSTLMCPAPCCTWCLECHLPIAGNFADHDQEKHPKPPTEEDLRQAEKDLDILLGNSTPASAGGPC